MPIYYLIQQEKITPDMTPILTAASVLGFERRSADYFADPLPESLIYIGYFAALKQLTQGLGIQLLMRIRRETLIRVGRSSGH